jgi:hypothetical protein
MFQKTYRMITTCVIVGTLVSPAPSLAEQKIAAANWCEEAKRYLTHKNGTPIDCNARSGLRCVMMNNYWCLKNKPNNPWKGTNDGFGGQDGRQDAAGHALFSSAEWAARAIAIDLKSKYMRGKKSAYDIAEEYSPWCDTLGSVPVREVGGIKFGRTCGDRGKKPPADFSGSLCRPPTSSRGNSDDCLPGCNCPPRVARTLVTDLPVGIDDDLKLFDSAGNPLPNLAVFIRNLAFQENSVRVRKEVIEAGIAKLQRY